ELLVNDQKFNCINEIVISSNEIQNIDLYINNYHFKSLITNQINIVNNLGSTGINRSNIKPLIFPWNHQYIVDVKNEPIYKYYKPLLQPLVLSNEDEIIFKGNTLILSDIKIDNHFIYNNSIINQISIKQKQSNCYILNLDNIKYFFDKLNNLF
ncbi:MAG: hypothetical protein K2L64_02160, partial [Ureaplasma sp.]|nr:hypothetical protein [Ureaplasma sp.]